MEKILFVGDISSTHAVSWMSLLAGTTLHVRCFATNRVPLAASCTATVHGTGPGWPFFGRRRGLPFSLSPLVSVAGRLVRRDLHRSLGVRLLANLVEHFQPDVIHCFGASDGGLFALDALDYIGRRDSSPRLVVQARGGPDLVDGSLHPALRPRLEALYSRCDLAICDSHPNYRRVTDLGCDPDRLFSRPVPGAGGYDAVSEEAMTMPSVRRRILYIPKAYEHYQTKLLPSLEALCKVRRELRDTTIIATAVNDEANNAIRRLPADVRDRITVYPRVPRKQALSFMSEARVMLAPSILDGVPNVLYEAMVNGAVPIVSPLDEIVEMGMGGANVLYARNLYPNEIAHGLMTALFDDERADSVARENFMLIRQLVDRAIIQQDVLTAYRMISES